MRTLLKRLFLLTLAALLAGVVIFASTKESQTPGTGRDKSAAGRGGGAPRQPVLAEEARVADLPIVVEGVGSVRALNTVTVRAQVEGKILKFNFKEGQQVHKGDVLAEIDPTTYKAAVDQAIAKRQLSQTQLDNARKDLERYDRVAAGVIAQKTIDTQKATVSQLEAQVRADQAAVASAQAVLDYTRVISPIDGRTGLRQVDEGNIVRSGDPNGLVVITQVQPIAVLFTLPQQQLTAINRAMNAGPMAAEAWDGENKALLDRGQLQVLDNQVDSTTGTIKLKAEFANPRLELWPGQFVNVRLTVDTLRQVVVVPTPAVQRGPTGPYVFVVTPGDTVAQRTVTLGVQTDTVSVVATGVKAGERVVTTGFTRLQDGAKVTVGAPDSASDAPADRPVAKGAGGDAKGGRPGVGGEGRQKRERRPEGRGGAAQVDIGAAEVRSGGDVAAQSSGPATGPPTSTSQ